MIEVSSPGTAKALAPPAEVTTTEHETQGFSWTEYRGAGNGSVFAASWGDRQSLNVQVLSSSLPAARLTSSMAIVTLNGEVMPGANRSLACLSSQKATFRVFSDDVVIAEMDGTLTALLPISWECVGGQSPQLLNKPRDIIAINQGREALVARHNRATHGGGGFLSSHAKRFPGVGEEWKRIVSGKKMAPRITKDVKVSRPMGARARSAYRWSDATGDWHVEFLQWRTTNNKSEQGVGATLYKKQGSRWIVSDTVQWEHLPDNDGDTTAQLVANSISIDDINGDGTLEASAVFAFGSRTDMSETGQSMYITEHGKFVKVIEGFTNDFPEASIELHERDQRDSIKVLQSMQRRLIGEGSYDAWPTGFE